MKRSSSVTYIILTSLLLQASPLYPFFNWSASLSSAWKSVCTLFDSFSDKVKVTIALTTAAVVYCTYRYKKYRRQQPIHQGEGEQLEEFSEILLPAAQQGEAEKGEPDVVEEEGQAEGLSRRQKSDLLMEALQNDTPGDEIKRQGLLQGIDLNARIGQFFPLIVATRRRCPSTLALLIEKGADPNKKDGVGRTALQYIADGSFYPGVRLNIGERGNMFRILLENGANHEVLDRSRLAKNWPQGERILKNFLKDQQQSGATQIEVIDSPSVSPRLEEPDDYTPMSSGNSTSPDQEVPFAAHKQSLSTEVDSTSLPPYEPTRTDAAIKIFDSSGETGKEKQDGLRESNGDNLHPEVRNRDCNEWCRSHTYFIGGCISIVGLGTSLLGIILDRG